MDITKALSISAAGMEVQTVRLRVIAQNLANQDTTASIAGGEPYRRKTVSFANTLDRATGAETVRISKQGQDKGEFPLKFDPAHPAADANGYIRTPNVNSFIEVMDMKEAQRSYNANLQVMQVSRGMLTRAIEMLK
jgi:flagellar basal-body rod protein FlgC